MPTDKPSRLFYWEDKLVLGNLATTPINRNIYITSDEEIKEGDWLLNLNGIFKVKPNYINCNPTYKKIILTTDQDLIKDGVQAIDDEFLEWFVKNQSFEEVLIEKKFKANSNYNEQNQLFEKVGYWEYEIVFPKEQTKPHTFCETPNEKCTMNYCDDNGCLNRKRNLVDTKEFKKETNF